ncbi:ACP S-malonyltransferase [Bowmanella sp. JS7-9]|uniref:Malonyl CoA-acyl carrier protein transacylase n=1 Tax=Pseudobowmanella zhangzhouensis TaxID=1537679 RepID=A0ABW1XJ97_9ALTE|nr:ACP S-malonyltransferase [Bowmanella sp. JS7-9]TBX27510.1 malonyl CoA-ACP transacylase [Bowmanella sp. JS7-9]
MRAFVFPGQGSQAVGMLADVAAEYPQIQATFAEASAALGYDLWQLVQQGPAEELNQTHITQPAILTASVALYRLYKELGGAEPAFMAGHSLGEYSALVCAGVLDFADAVKLVELRGKAMQEAVPAGTGAMYAIIGLEDDKIQAACEQAAQGEVVAPVNFNSPGQVVIAGNAAAVERAGVLCKEAGAKRALPLPVSVPSHCALMKPAADVLKVALDGLSLNAPRIPVINNVDVMAADDTGAIKDALVRQLYSPVRWTETVEALAAKGALAHFEVGPGKVLSGLAKRIDKSVNCDALNTVDALQSMTQE